MATWGKEQEDEMNGILQKLGVGQDVKAKFFEEKVYASTVRLLTDTELGELGLCLGDRVTLRKLCDEAVKSRTVCQEVRSILSPLPRASGGSSSGPQFLERRPKRKGKSKLAAEKYSPAPSASSPKLRGNATFQKKFVVVDYMGEEAPRKFAVKESFIVVRGILPELSLNAEESTVRSCVAEAIKHSEGTLSGLGPTGFEFLEACGKCLCVPAHNPGFLWTGRAVKALAGTGSIYVRLTEEREEEGSSEEGSAATSDDSEKPEVKIVKVEGRGAVSYGGNIAPSQPFFARSTRSRSQPVQSTSSGVSPPCRIHSSHSCSMTSSGGLQTANLSLQSPLSCSETPRDQSQLASPPHLSQSGVESSQASTSAFECSTLQSTCSNNEASSLPGSSRFPFSVSGEKLQFLSSAFPEVSSEKLKFILGLCDNDVDKTSAFFVKGVTLSSLLKAVKSFLVDEEEESVEWVQVENLSDLDQLKKAAMRFYQREDVNWRAVLKVELGDGGPQDEGGVRRQFLNGVISHMKSSLFEGPPVRLRPLFKQSSISSGALLTLGKMIGHSIVLDGLGFPFMSPPCYYAMAGRMDLAVSTLDDGDGGGKIERVVVNLRRARTEDDLRGLYDEVLDLMEESGCDKQLKMDNIEGICSELLGYNVLQKRRLMLDTLADGLDAFMIGSALRTFPLLFKPLFVASGKCCPSDVLNILKFHPGEIWLEGGTRRVAGYLKSFVGNLDETELMDFVKCVTGSPHCQGNTISVHFSADQDGPAFDFRTCIKQLVISELISNEEDFCVGLKAAISLAFNTA